MIKFFRKIRQKLLSENKYSKYLLYAIGEIVLVVIGILIALSVNNWNEIKKIKKIEISTLKELRSDLKQNRIEIKSHISALENCVKSNKVILLSMENKFPYIDSLDFHFSRLYPFIAFAPVRTTFDNLSQNGIKLISNDSLRNQISKLYENDFESFRVFESTYFVEHYSNYLKPMFMKEFETFEVYHSVKPKKYDQFILNQEYKQNLNFTVNISQRFIALQSSFIEIVDRLIINIDNEILD